MKLLQRSSTTTYLISLLLPRKHRRFFWLWYSYLRWVDDTVDRAAESRQHRCDFLDRQMELLRVLYEGKSPKLCDEEEFLGTLVAYDRGRGELLQQPLREMLVAMRFDIERERALADHAELHRNYEREVSSYLFTIAYVCAVPVTPARIPGSEAAKGAKIAHILRDFIVDCADGQFNISRQEIAAYRLELKSINTQITGLAGRRWVAVKVRIAERQLSSGLQDVSQVGGARYRIIVAILVAKYQTYLCQCRIDQFAPRPRSAASAPAIR